MGRLASGVAPSLTLLSDLDLKAPAILADLADRLAGLVDGPRTRRPPTAWRSRPPSSTVINPVSWFDSVLWGQVDSFGVVFLLLGLRELWRDRPERAAILTVIAALIKPQLGILIPIVAVVTIRRALCARPTMPTRRHDETERRAPASWTACGLGTRYRATRSGS